MASNHYHLILLGLLTLSLTVQAHNGTHVHTHTHTHSHSHSHSQSQSQSQGFGTDPLQALIFGNNSTISYNKTNLEELCKQTSFPASCLFFAQRCILVRPNMDIRGMLGLFLLESYQVAIMAEGTAALTTGAINGKSKISSDVASQHTTCLTGYQNAIANIRSAAENAVVNGEGKTAVMNLSAALQGVNHCKDLFKDDFKPNSLRDDANITGQSISIALSFARLAFNISH